MAGSIGFSSQKYGRNRYIPPNQEEPGKKKKPYNPLDDDDDDDEPKVPSDLKNNQQLQDELNKQKPFSFNENFIQTLSAEPNNENLKKLKRLSQDEDFNTRFKVVQALDSYLFSDQEDLCESALDLLKSMSEDEEQIVRLAVIEALKKIKKRRQNPDN